MIANELRVGNWVTLTELGESQTCIVDIDLLNKIFNDEYYTGIPILQPIPLQPEILEKCGLKDMDGYYKHDWFEIITKDGNYFFAYHNRKFWVEYLHQLQNLYFALTGEELKINI